MLSQDASRRTAKANRKVESILRDPNGLEETRLSSRWLEQQEESAANYILAVPSLIGERADSGETSAHIMDISPTQFSNIPQTAVEYENSDLFYGAAKYVIEWLRGEGFRVRVQHKGTINGLVWHELHALWE